MPGPTLDQEIAVTYANGTRRDLPVSLGAIMQSRQIEEFMLIWVREAKEMAKQLINA